MMRARRHKEAVKGKYYFYLYLLLFVAVIVGVLQQVFPRSRIYHGPRIMSYTHLHEIGIALRDYKLQYGHLPAELSNLVPEFIPTNQLAIFYVPNQYARQEIHLPDWDTNPLRVDEFSAYVYLGTNDNRNILAFEKTNLWKSSVSYPDKVAALFSDFHVEYVPIEKISGK